MKTKRSNKTPKSTWIIRIGVLFIAAVGFFGSYIVAEPTITDVSPGSGSIAGGTRITITGTDLNIKTTKVIDITAGGHSCAITDENKIYCWGLDDYGQLGNDMASTIRYARPQTVVTSVEFKQVGQGGGHFTCAISVGDKAYCWGANAFGQLGDGTTTDRYVPTAVKANGALAGKDIKQIGTGYSDETVTDLYDGGHTCALTSEGRVYCWGRNANGQNGDGTNTDSTVPKEIKMDGVLSGKTIEQISVGLYHTCAVTSDGKAYCWGSGGYGRLGNGGTTNSNQAVAVKMDGVLSGKTIKQISAGWRHTCAIASDDKAYCWGHNELGQLGDNTVADKNEPVAVNTSGVLGDKQLTDISVGEIHSCTLDYAGLAYCWGSDRSGQLGNSSSEEDMSVCFYDSENPETPCAKVPVAVANGTSPGVFSKISAGTATVCAISLVGQAYCWGSSTYGGVGSGHTNSRSSYPWAVINDLLNQPKNLSILVGGQPCTDILTGAGTAISCVTSEHLAGKVNVVISDGYDIVTATNAFEYTENPNNNNDNDNNNGNNNGNSNGSNNNNNGGGNSNGNNSGNNDTSENNSGNNNSGINNKVAVNNDNNNQNSNSSDSNPETNVKNSAENESDVPYTPNTGVMMRNISFAGFGVAGLVWFMTSRKFRRG